MQRSIGRPTLCWHNQRCRQPSIKFLGLSLVSFKVKVTTMRLVLVLLASCHVLHASGLAMKYSKKNVLASSWIILSNNTNTTELSSIQSIELLLKWLKNYFAIVQFSDTAELLHFGKINSTLLLTSC